MSLKKFFQKFLISRILATELIIASLFINVLALATAIFVIQVLSRYLSNSTDRTLVTLSTGVVIAIFLEICFRVLRNRIAAAASAKTHENLSQRAFSALCNIKMMSLDRLPIALRYEIMQSLGSMQKAYNSNNLSAFLDVPFAFLFIFVIAFLSLPLALIAIIMLFTSLLISRLSLHYSRISAVKSNSSRMEKNGLLNATITNLDCVRAFNSRNFVNKIWKRINQQWQTLQANTEQQSAFVQSLNHGITALTVVLIISVGAKLVVLGKLNIGSLIGANILAARALASASRLTGITSSLMQAQYSEDRMKKFLALPIELAKGTALKDYKGQVKFEDVGFLYPGTKTPVIESFDLVVKPHEVVGVIGPNGAGKTTLARMLVNLLEPGRGQILVDGVNLQQIAVEWWRKQISYLPQELTFFTATLAENISLPNPDISQSELNEIIELADLRQFVDNSVKGLLTLISDNGQHLPVGIRRRIALARALTTKGQLVILDEPAESLDKAGREAVCRVLQYLKDQQRNIFLFTNDEVLLKETNYLVDLGAKPTPKVIQKSADVA